MTGLGETGRSQARRRPAGKSQSQSSSGRRKLALYRGFEYRARSRTEPTSHGFQAKKFSEVLEVHSEVSNEIRALMLAINQPFSARVRIPPAPPPSLLRFPIDREVRQNGRLPGAFPAQSVLGDRRLPRCWPLCGPLSPRSMESVRFPTIGGKVVGIWR